jgi:hypothetical protein
MLCAVPEVFSNHFAFPGDATVPGVEAVRESLSTTMGIALVAEFHPAGEQGAPRSYARLEDRDLQFWVFWDAHRPVLEVQSPQPMLRMLAVNQAFTALGGTPLHDDTWWRDRVSGRRRVRIAKWVGRTLAAAVAVAMIWAWGWWGLATVVVLTLLIALAWYLSLARAFARG